MYLIMLLCCAPLTPVDKVYDGIISQASMVRGFRDRLPPGHPDRDYCDRMVRVLTGEASMARGHCERQTRKAGASTTR